MTFHSFEYTRFLNRYLSLYPIHSIVCIPYTIVETLIVIKCIAVIAFEAQAQQASTAQKLQIIYKKSK